MTDLLASLLAFILALALILTAPGAGQPQSGPVVECKPTVLRGHASAWPASRWPNQQTQTLLGFTQKQLWQTPATQCLPQAHHGPGEDGMLGPTQTSGQPGARNRAPAREKPA